MFGVSVNCIQNSPTLITSPDFPVYKVRQLFQTFEYPFVRRQISPVWRRSPVSSHIEMLMLPVLSATLTDLTSWPSLVRVGAPISKTINMIFMFFCPGLISFILVNCSPILVFFGRACTEWGSRQGVNFNCFSLIFPPKWSHEG